MQRVPGSVNTTRSATAGLMDSIPSTPTGPGHDGSSKTFASVATAPVGAGTNMLSTSDSTAPMGMGPPGAAGVAAPAAYGAADAPAANMAASAADPPVWVPGQEAPKAQEQHAPQMPPQQAPQVPGQPAPKVPGQPPSAPGVYAPAAVGPMPPNAVQDLTQPGPYRSGSDTTTASPAAAPPPGWGAAPQADQAQFANAHPAARAGMLSSMHAQAQGADVTGGSVNRGLQTHASGAMPFLPPDPKNPLMYSQAVFNEQDEFVDNTGKYKLVMKGATLHACL